LIIGVHALLFGVVVYYLMPLALISMNFGLLLQVFFIILIALFIGLTMLALNMQRLTESLLASVFFLLLIPFEPPSMSKLVKNNLRAHLLRNR
jgi:hypothetical protein